MKIKNNITHSLTSDISERNILLVSENEIRSYIAQEIQIKHVAGEISALVEETENALKQITDFTKISFFKSETHTFHFLSEYYKKKSPRKKILYFGYHQNFSSPNFSYIYQLRGAKAFLSENTCEVAVLILDPLFLIQHSVDYEQRILSLRTLCSGSGIPFILDERKTIARLHQKGLNFIFQFNADAVLLGENVSNGISLGALAHPSDFFDDSLLPGTSAPEAEGLLACKKITKELLHLKSDFFIRFNNKGNSFCKSVNKKLKSNFPKGLMNNFGSILWLNVFGCNRAHKKLEDKNILKGKERCIYLGSHWSKEEEKEFEKEIIDTLTKKKKRQRCKNNMNRKLQHKNIKSAA